MCNVPKTYIEKVLRVKKRVSLAFEKKVFEPQILNFGSFGMWISKNRQKWLSAVAKSFLRVVWCSKLYQNIAWTLRIVFHMWNVFKKYVEQILRAKKPASLAFEKSFWTSEFETWQFRNVNF